MIMLPRVFTDKMSTNCNKQKSWPGGEWGRENGKGKRGERERKWGRRERERDQREKERVRSVKKKGIY